MKLPVSEEYLACALKNDCRISGMPISQHFVGDLRLPTGKLVACDPVAYPETDAFLQPLPRGIFPVSLSVAQISDDQRVAFATIRFKEKFPLKWQVLTLSDEEDSPGYGVDSGVAGFMDHSVVASMMRQMRKDEEAFYETMDAEMKKTAVDTWSWLNVPFGKGNLIAFSPGYGDGEYLTYAGLDASGEVSVLVTDFGVASDE